MQFSNYANRFTANSGTVQLMDDLGSAQRATGPVYMLGGGNPAHIPAAEALFKNEMLKLVNNERNFGKAIGEYDSPQGNGAFIKALADLLRKRFGWEVGPENIAITNGSQSSFGILFNVLAGQYPDGSFRKIMLPLTPEYVGYSDVGIHEQPIFEGHRPTIEKLEDGFFKYRVDFDSLTIDQRYGAVCVSRPTNPTGNVITDDELAELARRCQAADVPLIIDGAYGVPFPGIVFSDATPLWNDNIILCLSLSKLGLPGLRTGIVIAQPEVIQLIKNANAINSLAPGRIGPSLVTSMIEDESLLTLCDEVVRPFYAEKVHRVIDIIKTLMPDLPVQIHKPEGALFVWLWFEDLPIHCNALYQRLVKEGVYVIAGHHFYPGLDDDWRHKQECIRVNYAGEESVVRRGLEIIAEQVRDIYRAQG